MVWAWSGSSGVKVMVTPPPCVIMPSMALVASPTCWNVPSGVRIHISVRAVPVKLPFPLVAMDQSVWSATGVCTRSSESVR